METVKIILSKNINSSLWDACVKKHQAPIYATTRFLNAMSKNWAAVIINDYETLFPFCYNKKLGIKYVYMPPFLQQLGIIGNPTTQQFNKIKNQLFGFVKFGDIMINEQTKILLNQSLTPKTNFELLLNKSNETLQQQFHTDVRRLTKRAITNQLIYSKSENLSEAISMYKHIYGDRMEKTSVTDFENFNKLAKQLQQYENCFVRKVSTQHNEILSISLFFKDDYRIYNLANSTTLKGRELASNFLLYQGVFKEFENSGLFFDFEGSDLPGVKEFYQMFKPNISYYYHWHFNKLPWFIKLLKPN